MPLKEFLCVSLRLTGMRKIFVFILFIIFSVQAYAQRNSFSVRKDTTQKKVDLFWFPLILYAPETRLAFGLGETMAFKTSKKDTLTRPSKITGTQLYTLNKQLLLNLLSDIYTNGNKYHIVSYASFMRFPNRFYGVGNNTDKKYERYDALFIDFKNTFERRIGKNFFAGITQNYRYFDMISYLSYGAFADNTIPGEEGGHTSGFGLNASFDNRDNVFYPSKGNYLKLSWMLYDKVFGSNYSFRNYTVDLRKYISVYKENILALQFYAEHGNGIIPFHMMSLMGGPQLMRGYFQGRFRDKNLAAFQAEARIPVWKFIAFTAFAGVGEVSPSINQFALNKLRLSGGAGIRLRLLKTQKLNMRLDAGFNKDSYGIYVDFSEAF